MAKTLRGYWSTIPSLQLHEIFSGAGFEFSVIDLEHGSYSFQEALEAVQVIQGSGMYALIRPSSHDPKEILRCLEIGPDGIMIPHVSTADEAKSLMSSCLYPPAGTRGASGFTRATKYGMREFTAHAKRANEDLFIVLLIESNTGLENIEQISQISRLDGIYFGTYDIASSMGLEDQAGIEVGQIISDSIDRASRPGLSFGQVATSEEQFEKLDTRVSFVPMGVDSGMIGRGLERFTAG